MNDKPALLHTMACLTIANKFNKAVLPAKKFPSGLGVQTLCQQCNGFTAAHYGSAYAEWTEQALLFATRYEQAAGQENAVLLPFRIQPLEVIKQIATMAIAVADLEDFNRNHDLRRFGIAAL